jgi:osmotically-inducible protein OsmY
MQYVSGFIVSHNMRQTLLRVVVNMLGVRRVEDCLYTDADLANAVSQVLKLDPLTEHTYNIDVLSNQRHVTLRGKVATAEIIKRAGHLPFRVPGVKAVINHISL